MSAELVDPFATPGGATASPPDLTADEWVAIRDDVMDAPWLDPARFPELVVEAVMVLGGIGLSGDPFSRREATQCLRRMVYRAKTGGWPGEQTEPAWSLDRDEPLYRHVLDGADLDPGDG